MKKEIIYSLNFKKNMSLDDAYENYLEKFPENPNYESEEEFFLTFADLFRVSLLKIIDTKDVELKNQIDRCRMWLTDFPGFMLFPFLEEQAKVINQIPNEEKGAFSDVVLFNESIDLDQIDRDPLYRKKTIHFYAVAAITRYLEVLFRSSSMEAISRNYADMLRCADVFLNFAEQFSAWEHQEKTILDRFRKRESRENLKKRYQETNSIKAEFFEYLRTGPSSKPKIAATRFATRLKITRPDEFRALCPTKNIENAVTTLVKAERENRKKLKEVSTA